MKIKIFISFSIVLSLIMPIFAKTLYKAKDINDYIQLIKISGTNKIKVRVRTKGQTNVNMFHERIYLHNAAIFKSTMIPDSDGTFDSSENGQGKDRDCIWFNSAKEIWDSLKKDDILITIYTNYYDEKEEKKLIDQYYEGKEITFITPLKIEYQFENNELTKYIYTLEKEDSKEQSVYYSKDKIIIDYLKTKKIKVPTDNIINFEEITINSENNKKRKQLKDEFDKKEEAEKLAKEKKKKQKLRKIIENPDSCNLTYENEDEIFAAIGFDEYNLSANLERAFKPLLYVESGTWISVPVQVFQVLGNNQFLFKCGQTDDGPFLFCGKLKKCCRKDSFYQGQWVDVVGIIDGTSSYVTAFGGIKTVPKVKVYAIRPSVAGQTRYY